MLKSRKLVSNIRFPIPVMAFIAATITLSLILACTNNSSARPNFQFKSHPNPDIVAKIAGKEISIGELKTGDAAVQFMELEQKMYDLKLDQVKALMQERLIGAEAEKAGMPLEDYINKKVIKGDAKISDAEFQKFVKERNVPKDKISPQLKERINSFLGEQKKSEAVAKYVNALTKNNPVEIYFSRPKGVDVPLGDAPVWGKADAPVTIVEFSDFQCPFCSRAADVVTEVKKKYGKSKVKIAFKHFPLPSHPEAKPASIASMCVADQSSDNFWKYHDLVFKNQRELSPEKLEEYAKKVGANIEKFKACFSSNKFQTLVESDQQQGEKLGVRATPTFFVNGRLISGAQPIEKFSEIIDEELASAE